MSENINFADARCYAVKGSAEDLDKWVGYQHVVKAPYPVNEAQIANFAAMVEDPNENYWDPEAAKKRYGSIISPAGMMMTWILSTPWHPKGKPEHGPIISQEVPLPCDKGINVSTKTWFHAPMRVGDLIELVDKVTAISPLKRTVVGEGYFLSTSGDCYNQHGEHLATNVNTSFRYNAIESNENTNKGAVNPVRRARDPALGQLEPVVIPVTTTTLAMVVAATRDYFLGHHDADFARSQGVRGTFLNTMYYNALVDRIGYAWAGYDAWLCFREMNMVASACIGDTLRSEGSVVARREEKGRRLVDLEIDLLTEHGVVVTSRLTFDLDGLNK